MKNRLSMGNKFGVDTALVATGVKNFHNNSNGYLPTYQLNSVADLIKSKI